MPSLSVVLQAGGQSTRMGHDKGLVSFKGESLLTYILDQVAGLGEETFIISNQPDDYASFGLPAYPDIIPGIGALGGLYSALFYSRCEYCLVLACDMPFINRPLLDYMVTLAPDFDLVIPRLKPEEFAEPFRAIYKKTCLAPIKAAIDAGQRRVISFFDMVNVRYVEWPEIQPFDPQRLTFFNINTPEDLAEAERLADQVQSSNV